MADQFVEFAFIVAVPLVVVAGGLVSLFAVGALFYLLEEPDAAARGIEAFFRGTPKPAKMAGPDNYYQAYWRRSPR